jgi:hypothetical protein
MWAIILNVQGNLKNPAGSNIWASLTQLRGIILQNFSSTQELRFSNIFWDNPLKVNRHFGGTYELHFQVRSRAWNQRGKSCQAETFLLLFALVSYLAYSWTLKMEAISSSEISVGSQRTTQKTVLSGTGAVQTKWWEEYLHTNGIRTEMGKTACSFLICFFCPVTGRAFK